MPEETKVCSTCSEEKPFTAKFFDLAIRSASCRDCRNSSARRRRAASGAEFRTAYQNLRELSGEIIEAITATSVHYLG